MPGPGVYNPPPCLHPAVQPPPARSPRGTTIALFVAASFLLVGAAVLPLRSGLLVRVLRWRPLAALGVASYSLYLWHYPIVEHLSKAPPPPRLPKAAGYGAEARARSTTMPAADGSAGPPAICAATSWNGPWLVPVTV